MSTQTGVHVRSRHAGEVTTRETHRPALLPMVEGLSWGEARDGEQANTQDIAPGAIDGSVHILPQTLSLDLFAEEIRPPTVVDALPTLPDTTYPQGALVFLTSDEKLYRNTDGSTWSVAVDGADIVANSITAGQIAAAAIGADEIAAGAITTEKFHVGARAPGVENATAEVLIDEDGITILNGKISLLDESGAQVMTAAGFEGPWLAFIRNGLYNSQFGAGTLGMVTYTGDVLVGSDEVPYWGYAHRNDAAMTLELKASALAASGKYLEFIAGTTTAFTWQQRIHSALVSVSGGSFLSIRYQWSAIDGDASGGTKPIQPYMNALFYDKDMVFISGVAAEGVAVALDDALGTWRWASGTLAVPSNAAFCTVGVGPQYPSGTVATSGMRIGEVEVGRGDAAVTTIRFDDTIEMSQGSDGIVYINDPLEVHTFLGLKVVPATGGNGTLEIQRSEDGFSNAGLFVNGSGNGSLEFGGGGAARDVVLSRTAANELTLADGGVLRLATTGDVGLATTGHAFQVGPSGGQNIRMDNNEIMSVSNGSAADLHLNADGGVVIIGNNYDTAGAAVQFNDDVKLTRLSTPGLRLEISGTAEMEWAAGGRILLTGGGYFEFLENTAPGAPAANRARFFCRDNGAGKTQLCAIFSSGAIQVIATQP